jgi:hypothetical protein
VPGTPFSEHFYILNHLIFTGALQSVVISLFQSYRRRNGGTESLNEFEYIMQLVGGGAGN